MFHVVLLIKSDTTKQMFAHVFSIEGYNLRCSLLTEGNTVGVLVSGDSGTDHTLGYTEWKMLYTSVYSDTEHCIDTIWWQYDILYKN